MMASVGSGSLIPCRTVRQIWGKPHIHKGVGFQGIYFRLKGNYGSLQYLYNKTYLHTNTNNTSQKFI
jgi:hypothetical protein